MMEIKSNFEYQVGGSLDRDAPSYVTRQADAAFYEALKSGQFCYVLNSRQMGKSSLRVMAMQRLQKEGTVCIFIDLTGMGTLNITPEKWYAGFVYALVGSCQLSLEIPWRTWWRDRQDLFSPTQRLNLFIQEVLLVQVKQNIVIFVDEVDRVLSQKFSLDDFFGLIRFFYEQRDSYPDYKRLTFALLGVATPNTLIRDKGQNPFNLGKAIELSGFQPREVQPLIRGLQGKLNNPEIVVQKILDWTGGQPFMTQKVCQLVMLELKTGNQNPQSIEQLIKSHVIENWEEQDEPEHLRTIRDRILRNEQKSSSLLGLYQQILEQREIQTNGSPEQMELRLSGLVVVRGGQLKVHNRIYEAVFDQNWVDQRLAKLRPYAKTITAWLSSNCQDESSLLRGKSLQDTLTWSLDKSLSDLDYQYLVTSQELAKREAQTALEASEQASQLLASARQKAKQTVLKERLRRNWLPIIALGVTVPILLLRLSGLLQGLEWNLLDQFFRWRSLEAPDTRIVLVAIDEADISKLGQWPMSDRVLTQVIAKIKAQQPRVIGLDLCRDLPVEPGHTNLLNLFESTPNLFGTEKVVAPRIAPPPILSQRHQVGFADQVLDADGKARRALLSVSLSESDLRYSLAVQTALYYLKSQGVTLEELGGERVRLGQAIFERFNSNDGGYVRADSGGYQILLNFRGAQKSFPTFSLQQVLTNQLPPNTFRDRLVLIGATAESLNDLVYTPYSGGLFSFPERMAGVYIHANIASQLLSGSLDGRPLLRVWTKPLECLGILACAGLGVALSWRWSSSSVLTLTILLASGDLLAVCYLAFLLGWWLPIVPSILALWGAAITLSIFTNKQREKFLFRRTLEILLAVSSDYPTVARIALEYLRQSETKENQAIITLQLNNRFSNQVTIL